MSRTIETHHFLEDLDRVAQVRRAMAQYLQQIAERLGEVEAGGLHTSGKLGLDREIEDVTLAGQNLAQGVFRLLVLGDMKRGKSTFLNALMGENLLPSDVNPCTALLTVLKYGPEKGVEIHFKDDRPPEKIDFAAFKARYTIAPQEAKQLEARQEDAFPAVSHAVVAYPLPLLEKGIEIVDSPGLNDTEARNELSLGYINNCHAILFVMRATQPCTLAERRYLENYIQGRGLSIFFLINAWDQVKESLIDPDDEEELQEAADKLHKVFRSNLQDYCQIEGEDWYDERMFAISALQALRRRIKDENAALEETGFPEFMGALNTFLTQERAIAEFRQARTLARQAHTRLTEAIGRRIPLLSQTVEELKTRLDSVEPEFNELHDICDRFKDEIRTLRDQKARAIADSFRTYLLNLEQTFEQDFLRYQPDLGFLDFLRQNRREAFAKALQQAFEQYVNDKFQAWVKTAETDLDGAFEKLARSASEYGMSYTQITDRMTEKLTGKVIGVRSQADYEEASPGWAKWAMGLVSLASGNVAGVALAATGFDWKSILLNFLTVTSVAFVAASIFSVLLGPVSLALVGLGVGALQADQARKELIKVLKRELVKYLPQVAQEQWQPIYQSVRECFDKYETEVMRRINDDIEARKAELDNLVKQKESHEINRDAELARLEAAAQQVLTVKNQVEQEYQTLLG
ncbi:MAG: dynamin family protein [Leptolyngbya sp. SIO1E4]|nr:dynamin family protein [Leptolyngbya sp. SIO1E4]